VFALHEAFERQRIRNLVRDDQAVERGLRQTVEPLDAAGMLRERFLLPLPQRRDGLQDQVSDAAQTERIERGETLRGERAAARAELEDRRRRPGREPRRERRRERARKRIGELRRRDEIAARADLLAVRVVVAEPRLVERKLDVPPEADPAAGRRDRIAYSRRQRAASLERGVVRTRQGFVEARRAHESSLRGGGTARRSAVRVRGWPCAVTSVPLAATRARWNHSATTASLSRGSLGSRHRRRQAHRRDDRAHAARGRRER